jgi:hypothetical protein
MEEATVFITVHGIRPEDCPFVPLAGSTKQSSSGLHALYEDYTVGLYGITSTGGTYREERLEPLYISDGGEWVKLIDTPSSPPLALTYTGEGVGWRGSGASFRNQRWKIELLAPLGEDDASGEMTPERDEEHAPGTGRKRGREE